MLAYATFSEAPSSAPKTEGAEFGVLEREAQGVGSRWWVQGFSVQDLGLSERFRV